MGVQQRSKHPRPVVRAAHGHGICLLAHGEPHAPCPVQRCAGNCGSRLVEAQSYVVCSVQSQHHGCPSPWCEDDLWWRQGE